MSAARVVVFQWLRIRGDVALLAGGVIVLGAPLANLRRRRPATVADGEALPQAVIVVPSGA